MNTELRYQAVVFDLDGTLLDTLDDLKNSANAAAQAYGMPAHSREAICSFVGNGIRNLISKVVPEGDQNPDFDKVFAYFKEHYAEHCMDETKPYDGIIQLLDELKAAGVKTAIVSNKADFAVKKLKDVYFKDNIQIAIGERTDIRRKPAPDTVFAALKELEVSPEHAVYVGDSEVDCATANNAAMDYVLVDWGFRSREHLLANGAEETCIVSDVAGLKGKLL